MTTTAPSPQDLLNLAEDVAAQLLAVTPTAGQRATAQSTFVAMLERTLVSGIQDLGMFSPMGNLTVRRMLDRQVKRSQALDPLPSLEAIFEQVDGELDYLSRNTDYREAGDTAVRDEAFDYIRKAMGA